MYNRKKSKTIWIVVGVAAAAVGIFIYLKRKGLIGKNTPQIVGGKKI